MQIFREKVCIKTEKNYYLCGQISNSIAMTKKTKRILLWVVGLWVAICVIMAIVDLSNRGTSDVQEPVPSEKVATASADIEGTVIGRWHLTSEIAPSLNSVIVIYENGDSCYCKETLDSGGSVIRSLRKEGNKYFNTESSVGEYYLVTNGTMRLFDDDGEYGGGTGYTITTLE